MTSSRLAEMFERAVSLPAAERAAWVYRHCCDDPTLRARLESLLRAHEQAGGFLESVPPDLLEDPAPPARMRGRARYPWRAAQDFRAP